MLSALLPKADIDRHDWHVRFVPKADKCTAAKMQGRLLRRYGQCARSKRYHFSSVGGPYELLKGQPIPERPLYAAFAPGAPLPEKVHSFVDHLSEWFRKHPL